MEWAASAFERRLGAAYDAGDLAVCLSMLRDTELALPAPPEGDAAWPTITAPDRVWLPAYTSVEAMRAATGLSRVRITSLVELAAGWPDPRWGLAVNPGLPVRFLLEPGTVARLAVPTLAQDRRAEPEPALPVVQKPLTPHDLRSYLGEGSRASRATATTRSTSHTWRRRPCSPTPSAGATTTVCSAARARCSCCGGARWG